MSPSLQSSLSPDQTSSLRATQPIMVVHQHLIRSVRVINHADLNNSMLRIRGHVSPAFPCVGLGCVLCPRIDPLRFLAGCRRRRLNQGLRFFLVVRQGMFLCYFTVYRCMLCLVCYLFVISTSVIDFLGSFVPEMTYYVSSWTLNLTKLNSTLPAFCAVTSYYCNINGFHHTVASV